MTLRNSKVQDKKFKSFWNKFLKFLSKHFAENGKEEENLRNWFFIFKQLEKRQKEYYPDNLNWRGFRRHTSLHVLMFPISLLKRNLSLYWKWQTFEGKVWPLFMTSKKKRFIFLKAIILLILLTILSILFLIIIRKKNFFKNI